MMMCIYTNFGDPVKFCSSDEPRADGKIVAESCRHELGDAIPGRHVYRVGDLCVLPRFIIVSVEHSALWNS